MPNEDWQRTSCEVIERGGSLVTELVPGPVQRRLLLRRLSD
jgi:hypothetical protein